MKRKPLFASLAFMLVAASPTALAAPRALSQFVSVELAVNRTTVGMVIQSITQQTGYEFSYDDAILSKEISNVSLNVKNERIEKVLDKVFKGTGISYKIIDNRIFLREKGKGYTVDYYALTSRGGGGK